MRAVGQVHEAAFLCDLEAGNLQSLSRFVGLLGRWPLSCDMVRCGLGVRHPGCSWCV